MPDIIDFRDEHDKRHGPDPEHVVCDEHGVKWFEFACSYVDYEGCHVGFRILAKDQTDADRRIEALRKSARVDGQVYATVPG